MKKTMVCAKMKKYINIIFVSFIFVLTTLLLSACYKKKNMEEHQTGYPSGQPQEIMVFYDGNLYRYLFGGSYYTEDSLPEDYIYVGKPTIVTYVPCSELEASCVQADVELYYSQSENCVFVKNGVNNYKKLLSESY